MVALISFFVILLVSLAIVRVAEVMLELTGISKDSARFQARSAFTGTGFTTHEAEMLIKHQKPGTGVIYLRNFNRRSAADLLDQQVPFSEPLT